MRIEKLEFSNLNSLVGRYTIDFTHPSLADAGMFIISGPTGAGKTTILDAISYGLYGSTPRLQRDGISNTKNELMSRGAKDCFASVTFETGGTRYVVTSKHRRAKARSSAGNPFSSPERLLYRVCVDGSNVLMENQVRAVDRRVVELTGLNFKNFIRCMMLAQGEFARFMKADKSERAEVLATITGTEIYERIGQRVQERVAEQEKLLESLLWQEVMRDEVRATKEVALKQLQAEVNALRAENDGYVKALDWLARVADCESRCRAAVLENEAAVKQLDDFRQGENARCLTLARAAEKVVAVYDARLAARKRLKKAQDELAEARERVAQAVPCVEAAQKQLAVAQAECEEQLPLIENQQKIVREKLMPAETKLEVAQVGLNHARSVLKQAECQQLEADNTLEKAERAREKHASLQQEHAAKLQSLLPDAALPENMNLVESRLRDLQGVVNDESTLPQSAAVQTALEANARAQAALLQGRSREALAADVETLVLLKRACDARQVAESQSKSAQQQYDAALRAQQELPDLQAAEERERRAREAVEGLRAVCDIREQLADLYEKFKAGQYAKCPCCGSTTHGEPDHVEEGMLREAQETARSCAMELKDLQKKRQAADVALATAKGRLDSALATLKERDDERHALLEKMTEGVPEDLSQTIDDARLTLAKLDALAQERADWERRRDVAVRYDDFLQVVRGFTATLPVDMPGVVALVKLLRVRAKEYMDIQKLLEADRETLAQDKVDCEKFAAAKEAATELCARAKRELSSAEEAFRTQREARDAVWSAEESSGAALARLESRQKSLLDGRQVAQLALESANVRLSQFKLVESQCSGTMQTESRALEDESAKLEAVLQEQGFADESAFVAARLHIPRLVELEELLKRLETAKTESAAKRKTLQNERDRCVAEALATEPAETLRERQSAVLEKLPAVEESLKQVHTELAIDDRSRAANSATEARRRDIVAERDRWRLLFTVLGGKKEGFKQYAQQITFDCLIDSANAQLRNINDRYELFQAPGDDFALYVTDRWSDDEKGRNSNNLSGGECFIVSLALALGLSHLAGSDTSIDTLFLDEGFGTLDADALEKVLASLEKLRTEGKLIGIISHVDSLKERMPASACLEVLRSPSSATSTLAPHPAISPA